MADKCLKCSVVVSDTQESVKCQDCTSVCHLACCEESADGMKKLRSRKNKWRCDPCKAESGSTASKVDTDIVEPSSVMDMLKLMRAESNRRFDGIDESVKEVKLSVEEFRTKIEALETENQVLKERCTKTEESLQATNTKLKTMEMELLDMQQYSRRNNIEVKGVPRSARENVYMILEYVAGALNIPYRREDFSTAHRLPAPASGNGHPAIIAAFISRTARDQWLSAARSKRLTTADISPQLPPGQVFVNPHLTGYNKRILGQARQLMREKKLFSVWTSEGRVMVRHQEKGPALRIAWMGIWTDS